MLLLNMDLFTVQNFDCIILIKEPIKMVEQLISDGLDRMFVPVFTGLCRLYWLDFYAETSLWNACTMQAVQADRTVSFKYFRR